ncbi:hypothetical protein ACWF9B_20420 [Streptomyces sp. NPDC055089]
MTERKIDSEAPGKRQAETPDDKNPPGRPTNDQYEPEATASGPGQPHQARRDRPPRLGPRRSKSSLSGD